MGLFQQTQNERSFTTTQESNENLSDDLKSVVHGAEELLSATAGQTGEKVSEARRRLAAAVESAKATCQRLEQKAVAAAKATDHVIRDHPYESIGAAFGLGLLIGVLVGRK